MVSLTLNRPLLLLSLALEWYLRLTRHLHGLQPSARHRHKCPNNSSHVISWTHSGSNLACLANINSFVWFWPWRMCSIGAVSAAWSIHTSLLLFERYLEEFIILPNILHVLSWHGVTKQQVINLVNCLCFSPD